MKTNYFLSLLCGVLALLLQGCALTSHPLGQPAMGKPSSSAEMERLIDQPGRSSWRLSIVQIGRFRSLAC